MPILGSAPPPGEIGYAQITASALPVTSSAPPQLIAGLSITVTVGSSPIDIEVFGLTHSNVSNAIGIYYIMEGATQLSANSILNSNVVNDNRGVAVKTRIAPSPGIHTYSVGVTSLDGVSQITPVAFSTIPMFIQVMQV